MTGTIDACFGVEVTILARVHDPEEREAWRRTGFDPRDDVAELYGRPEPPPRLRVLVFDRDRLIRPAEAPGRRLLPLDRARGEDALPTRALWFRTAVLSALLVLAGSVLLAVGWRPRANSSAG
jgi:hypothetical protein